MESPPKKVVGRPFQKGQSGNPGGRKALPLTKAILSKLTPKRAETVAEVLIAKAEAGESWAVQVLYERTEGKVPTKNENGGPGAFDLDLEDVDTDAIKAALRRVK